MKRTLLTGLFALVLCVCLCPTFGAEEPDYLWYTDNGRTIYSPKDGETVAGFEGQRFYFSADGGASYAELPDLREQSERVWSDYVLHVTPLEGGALELKARNLWEQDYTWRREYTAEELAAALSQAQPTPVRVLATNGAVTLAVRSVKGFANDDLSAQYGYAAGNRDLYGARQLIYSTDGVTWSRCEFDGLGSAAEAWWDGSAFCLWTEEGQFTSTDGIRWAGGALPRRHSPKSPFGCALGPYYFELVDGETPGHGTEVYLMGERMDEGVLLPHMGELFRNTGVSVGELQAWYGPDDTVMVAVYDWMGNGYTMSYQCSSLDWCLEHLSAKFREPAPMADGGTVALSLGAYRDYAYYNKTDGQLIRRDTAGSGRWERVENVPWSSRLQVLPYNGKTFLVKDTAELRLWCSEDGLTWREVEGLRPEGMRPDSWDYWNCAFAWTGKGYLFCREAAEYRHGMMGHAGGQWYAGNTKVYLLDEAFRQVGEYDFGRLVEGVGYADGMLYAQAANSDGATYQGNSYYHSDGNGAYYTYDEGTFDPALGSALYRSADGKSWEPCEMTPELEQIIQLRK